MMRIVVLLMLFMSSACMWQYDPTPSWEDNAKEEANANRVVRTLTESGEIPAPEPAGDNLADVSPIMQRYQTLCASCHGAEGKGNGPAAAGLKPAPRNFADAAWKQGLGQDKERMYKVIKLGVAGAGYDDLKNVAMAPWGGVLSEEELQEMVTLVQSFE